MQIQEAVYESLTQQLELAKVQEAKETPSVKVLDPATTPERKSYPPRLMIMLSCAVLALLASAMVLLGKEQWAEVDPQEPGKLFALEVFHTLKSQDAVGTAKWFSDSDLDKSLVAKVCVAQ